MKLPPLSVAVRIEGIEEIIDEIKALQTFKLFENDDMILVDRAEVAEILQKHIKTSREDAEK